MAKTYRLAVSIVIVLGLAACGKKSNNSANPNPVPTPTPAPSTTTIFSGAYTVGAAPAGGAAYGFQDVSVPAAGQVNAAFDWTFTTTDIDMVVTATTCTDGVAAYNNGCVALGSDKGFTKPARVVFSAQAGVIRIWLYNFATRQESGVLNVLLTR